MRVDFLSNFQKNKILPDMLNTIYSEPLRKRISDRLVKIGKMNLPIYSKNHRYRVSSQNSLLSEFVAVGLGFGYNK